MAKRPVWQLHLSTMVILVILAGAMMPFSFAYYKNRVEYFAWDGDTDFFPWIKPAALIFVILFPTLILFFVGVICEYLIRRRRSKSD